jgi:type IV pilus assembly protein PilW
MNPHCHALGETNVQTMRSSSGFSLIELMVALALGLILSVGIVSLFGSTSKSNQVQNSLARLQENGRYAMSRMETDLRMQTAQYCSTTSGESRLTDTVTPTWPPRSPMVYASAMGLPDSNRANSESGYALTTATAGAAWEFNPRWYLQGYDCTGGACTPVVPTTDFTAPIPVTGLAVGQRVPNTDVLTLRYQSGTGWGVSNIVCNAAGGSVTLDVRTGDDSITTADHSFAAGNLALFSDCGNPMVLTVTGTSGTQVNIGALLAPIPAMCSGSGLKIVSGGRDTRLFNMTKDFVTVSYFLKFAADANPDAQPNSPAPQRLVPTLIRRVNGVDQELVQGVDRLDFLFAVQDGSGPRTRYLNANQVQSRNGGTIPCPPPLNNYVGTGCLWAAVRSIEVHMLLNTVDNMGQLDQDSRSFTYSIDPTPRTNVLTFTTPIPGSGLQAGGMLRREFVSMVAVRNNNP